MYIFFIFLNMFATYMFVYIKSLSTKACAKGIGTSYLEKKIFASSAYKFLHRCYREGRPSMYRHFSWLGLNFYSLIICLLLEISFIW